MERIKSYIHKKDGKEIRIFKGYDDYIDPREYSNNTVMVCFHDRYKLPCENKHIKEKDFESWDELKQHLLKNFNIEKIKPVYMLDHSGLSFSTKPFGCKWDSGQVGFIYIHKDDVKDFKKEIIDDLDKVLDYDVELYNAFNNGYVLGYHKLKLEKCEHCNHIEESVEEVSSIFLNLKELENDLKEKYNIEDYNEVEYENC